MCALVAAWSHDARAAEGIPEGVGAEAWAQWRRLLHADEGGESDRMSQGFYLSPSREWSPRKELEAALSAFSEPAVPGPAGEEHPQCRFPVRYAWLVAEGLLAARSPEVSCPTLEAYRARHRTTAVELVHAADVPDRPASAFGHLLLLLRLESHEAPDGWHPSDVVVDIAADADASSAWTYLEGGLSGRFRGWHRLVPAWRRLTDYAHRENRDLWLYRLDLSPSERARLVDHLWELRTETFPYRFLSRNCASEAASLVGIAAPRLRERLVGLSRPTSVVAAVEASGAILARRRVRSLGSRVDRSQEALRADDDATDAGAAECRAALDTLEWQTRSADPVAAAAARREIRDVAGRCAEGQSPPEVPCAVGECVSPGRSHEPTRVSFAAGATRGAGAWAEATLRPGLHGATDSIAGRASLDAWEIGQITLRYWHDPALMRLHSLGLLEVLRFPREPGAAFGTTSHLSLGCSSRSARRWAPCDPAGARLGWGPAFHFRSGILRGVLYGRGEGLIGLLVSKAPWRFHAETGVRLGSLIHAVEWLSIDVSAAASWEALPSAATHRELKAVARLHASPRWSLEVRGAWESESASAGLGAHWFF